MELSKNKQIIDIEAFQKPLFNEPMEKELRYIITWLKKQNIQEDIKTDTCFILSEIAENNRKLREIINIDIDSDDDFYRLQNGVPNLNSEFKTADFRVIARKPFLSLETENYLFYLHRAFLQNELDDVRYEFLHILFMELSTDNRYLRTKYI